MCDISEARLKDIVPEIIDCREEKNISGNHNYVNV